MPVYLVSACILGSVSFFVKEPSRPSSRALEHIFVNGIADTPNRVNIANANVYGMSKELDLTGNKYNTGLVIFFVPYILFEVPSNLLLRKLKPHVWLSSCMVSRALAAV